MSPRVDLPLVKRSMMKCIHDLLLKEQEIYLYQVPFFKKKLDKLLQNLVVMSCSRHLMVG
jgi:hypothetical protein